MTRVSTGDLAQTYFLRRQNTDLKTALNRLTQEMGSGQKADLGDATSGDFRTLAGIDHSLTNIGAYHTTTTEAGLFAETLQRALATIQTLAADVAPSLLQTGSGGSATQIRTVAADARQRLFSAVGALNVRVADRYALSGDATDKKPLSDAQDILDGLMTVISGQITITGVSGAVDTWFNAPVGGGGFLDTVYGGSATPIAPFQIGEGEQASVTLTATDPVLRDTLKGLAMAALVAEGALPGDQNAQSGLLKLAGQGLTAANSNLAELRGNLGSVEAHISDVETRNMAEKTALQLSRNGITAVDPFETANDLQATKTQLETMYTLTARLSRLSLADFLR